MTPGKYPALWWTLALALAAGVFWLSSSPDAQGAARFIDLSHPRDKIVHAGIFGVLGGLVYMASGRVVAAVGLASLYGMLDELHQATVPGREASVLDWLADTLGAILVVGLLWALSQRKGRKRVNYRA